MLQFQWDKGNTNKIRKRFTLVEIEQFFQQNIWLFFDMKHSDSEHRYIAVGNGPENKPMFVCFTFRSGLIRVISARFMRKKELESYEKIK